ncbi:MAG: VOC family protein, partial [Nitrospiraceae bacterium]
AVDYAKFGLTTPPLNFSLVSSPDCTRSPQPRQDAALPSAISAVNHLGIEVDNPGEVSGWERRLREHGIVEKVEDNIECCFARQDKVWFTDPDGNQWEIFTVHEQLPVSTSLQETSCCAPTCCVS